ncbi:MAG TPA: 50S ribosomal protein L9 [Ktedonobacterales bacterium]
MKVILLSNVAGLGSEGELKDVADGYARNYLLPKNFATPATADSMRTLRERLENERRRKAKLEAEQKELAAKLEAVTLKFAVRTGTGGRLYGSVTNQDIATALAEQEGVAIDRRTIHLQDPLRRLGSYEVPVRITTDLEPKLKIELIAAGEAGA